MGRDRESIFIDSKYVFLMLYTHSWQSGEKERENTTIKHGQETLVLFLADLDPSNWLLFIAGDSHITRGNEMQIWLPGRLTLSKSTTHYNTSVPRDR